MPEIVRFRCNGASVDVEVAPGETLLSVLRERLHITSAKDGCAPQGQCGCCTVLVDGDARVACVTPATRVQDRSVTTVEGLDQGTRDQLAQAFVDTGGSQCGFCTPGIVMRAAALLEKGKTAPHHLERALAAHLCRCTGWRTVSDAILVCAEGGSRRPLRAQTGNGRGLDAAGRRAVLEGGAPQRVGADVPVGGGGFADDRAPRDALVAVPLPPGSSAPAVEAAGLQWVVAETLLDARAAAAKVQGRRTTIEERPPLELPPCPTDGVRLATSWVEPAYLEPDASWCEPGGEPATPLANGGAFGGKETSPVAAAARELADHSGRTVRVLLAREDVVRLGPKRSPIAAAAHVDGSTVRIAGTVAGRAGSSAFFSPVDRWPYDLAVEAEWDVAEIPGPPTGPHLRAAGLAEHVVLLEGALAAARAERGALATDERAAAVLLDTCAPAPAGSAALAGARVELAPDTGALSRVEVRVAAGDVLDAVVLRSYATGAAHMALGWVLTEGLAVDPETGEVHDLTIRSFDIIRAKDTPPIDVTILEDPGPPCPRSSDAVFAAVAAAAWNAVTATDGQRPEGFPARQTRAARRLRR